MNSPEPDPLERWLKHQRAREVPQASAEFADRVLDDVNRPHHEKPPRVGTRLLQLAALVVVAAIGFLRLELFSYLIISTL